MKICPTCGATYPDNVEVCPKDGTKLVVQGASQQQSYVIDNRFKIGTVLEQRPIGVFYDGEDLQTHQKVVVFFSNNGILPDGAAIDRAIQEWELQGKVQGAQKVLHKGKLPDGRIYAVLEPLPQGMTLASRIAKGVIPVNEAVGYLRGMVSVLSQAASQGLYHRELGPSNVYLLQSGGVMLTNFPMAQMVLQGVFGDPWFMSPEQAKGQAPGVPSLVYSASALFYYMIVGRPPFPETDYRALVNHHLQSDPTPPSQARPGVPAQLDAVIAKAMAKDSGARFPTLEAFLSEVEKAVGVQSAAPQQAQATPQQAQAAPQQAQAAPQQAQEASKGGSRRSPRRRKKGGFRETLWFKKGMEMAEGEDDKPKKEGEISDEYKDLEERYKDGSEELTEEDRAKFSVRTGRTGVFQAVKMEDAKVIEKKRQKAEVEMMAKRQQRNIIIAGVSLVVVAVAAVGGIFFARTVLYKPYIKAESIAKLDKILKEVKAPPRKWIVPSGSAADLLNKAKEAMSKGNLVLPKGQSAVEYYLGAVKAKGDAKKLAEIKAELVARLLSRNHLLPKAKDTDYAYRVAEAVKKVAPNHKLADPFLQMMEQYKKFKKLGVRMKTTLEQVFSKLPEYPAPKVFMVVKKPRSFKSLLNAAQSALKKGRVLKPVEKSAVSYWVTYRVNKVKRLGTAKKKELRRLKKLLSKLAKEEASVESRLVKALEEKGTKAIEKKDWKALKLVVEALGKVTSKSTKASEWVSKYGKNFPPQSLDEVNAGVFTLER